MPAASRTQRQDYEDGLLHAPVHFLEHFNGSPQPYNTSGLEPDLSMQSHIEVVHSNRGLQPHVEEPHSNMGLQPEKTPSQKTSRQARGFRRTSFLLLVALVVAVVMATVLGGTLGSLIRKEKTDSKASSEDGSKTKNATVIVTHTTSISQDRLQMLRRRRLLFPLLLRVHPSLRWGLVKHTLISHLLRSLYLETGPEVMVRQSSPTMSLNNHS